MCLFARTVEKARTATEISNFEGKLEDEIEREAEPGA